MVLLQMKKNMVVVVHHGFRYTKHCLHVEIVPVAIQMVINVLKGCYTFTIMKPRLSFIRKTVQFTGIMLTAEVINLQCKDSLIKKHF